MGRAPSLLSRPRVGAFVALLAVVLAYYEWHGSLPTLPFWWTIVVLAALVMPAVLVLVWLALPLWSERRLIVAAVVLGGLAAVCEAAGFAIPANFLKLAATTALGFWAIRWFEDVSWVVLIACLIPFVDAFSVYRGPTETITKHHFSVYEHSAIAFVSPGHHGAALFGPPDLIFFALFLAAAARFRLRASVTWLACVAGYGMALVIANATDRGGVPALPFLSVAFLLANADLLWRRWRESRARA